MKISNLAQHRRRQSLRDKETRRRRLRVECLEDRRLLAADYGDAPDQGVGVGLGNYQTIIGDNGPSHTLPDTGAPALFLGTTVDADSGSLQNIRANADDVDSSLPDDEDGVLDPLDLRATIGAAPVITVSATNSSGEQAILAGWIDYNQNGVFEPEERATTTVNTGSINERFLLEFPTIASGLAGQTYARLRISSDAAFIADPTPIGAVSNGEVEDYQFVITARSNGLVNSSVKLASGLNGVPAIPTNNLYHAPANLGDFDGDGIDDLVVTSRGLSGQNQPGSVYIHRMNADGTVRETTSFSISSPNFGSDVDAIGDVNGDGVTDLVVGSNVADGGNGAVFVIFLNSDGSMQSNVKIGTNLNGGPPLTDDNIFGASVAGIGDLDGDGTPDVSVGAYLRGGTGAVFVLHLNADGTVREYNEIRNGLNGLPSETLSSGDAFGYRVEGIGDLDGDGVSDMAVQSANGDSGRGKIHLLLMNRDGTVKDLKNLSSGIDGVPVINVGDSFGRGIAAIDDIDGNGIDDIFVGVRGDDTGGADRGAAYLLFLNADGSVADYRKIAGDLNGGPPLTDGDAFGDRIASIGDLNGDGISEIAVMAAHDDTGNPNQGAVHVLFLGEGNKKPTLDPISNLTIDEDAGQQTVNLSGITAGGSESQPLRITAVSSNTALIQDPTVTYTSANTTGILAFTPVADKTGVSTVTVTVEDGGLDGDLTTPGDNETFTRTFEVVISPVNDVPTLDAIVDLTIDEDAAEQTISLTGIAAGGGESQPVRLTASSSNTALIPDPTVIYTSAEATGILKLTPVADQSGPATITVTVEDGGLDGDLATATDNLSFSRTFDVTVVPINDPPSFFELTDVALAEDSGEFTIDIQDITADSICSGNRIINGDFLQGNSGFNSEYTFVGESNFPNSSFGYSIGTSGDHSGDGRMFVGNSVNHASTTTGNQLLFPVAWSQTVPVKQNATYEFSAWAREVTNTSNPSILEFSINGTPVGVLDPTGVAASSWRQSVVDWQSADSTTALLEIVEIGGRTQTPGGGNDFALDDISFIGNCQGRESQPLRLAAASDNIALIPEPAVVYTSPATIGSLILEPATDAFGTATITVTVEDGGLDNDLATTADNATFSRTFDVVVNPINDDPTLDAISDLTIDEDAAQQIINLTGIGSGPSESQSLRVIATSDNTGLIEDHAVTYTSANPTGSLAFTPIADQYGTATITVTVEDSGLDNDFATTADNATFSRSFDVIVTPVNDEPTLESLPDVVIDEDGVVHGDGTNLKLFASDVDSDESQLEFRIANLTNIDPQFGLSIGMDPLSDSFALRSDNTIHVHPAADFFGSAQVVIEARDPEGAVSNQQTFDLIIDAVNDPPTLDPTADLKLNDVIEDSGAPLGQVGAQVSTLIDENGSLSNFSDIDGVAPGIAVVGKNIAIEKIWFSTDDGQNWQETGSVSVTEALLLEADATTRVYLQTAEDVSGDLADALTIKAWDQTGGYSNGQVGVDSTRDAFSSQTDTVSISVESSPSSAADDSYSPEFDGIETFVISKADLLANDTLGNGESIETVTITADATSAAGGTITADGDQFTYTRPASWFSGIDTFTYALDDGGSISTATVTIISGLVGETLTITLEPGRDHEVTLQYMDDKLVMVDHVTDATLLNIPRELIPVNVEVVGAPANTNIVTFKELTGQTPGETNTFWSYQGGSASDELAVLGTGSQWAWLSSDPQVENDVTVELKLLTTLIDTYTMIAVEKVSVGQVDRVEFSDPYLEVGAQTFDLGSTKPVNLPTDVTISDGILRSSTPVGLQAGESIVGSGTIAAPFGGGVASVIRATGNLVLGNASDPDGFLSFGRLEVGKNTVTLLDGNQAELGSLTTLGDELPGTLLSDNGLILEFGDNLQGYGTLQSDANGTIINNGSIAGTSAEQPITINSRVKGVGTFDNVVMNGEFTPGFSPALWKSGTVAYTDLNRFVIELGGRIAGAEFDRVEHYLAKLGGTLDVQLIDGFKPALGDLLEVITSEQPFEGDFKEILLPLQENGVRIQEILDQHGISLETVYDVADTLEVLKSEVAEYEIAGHDGSGLKVQGDRFRAFVTSLHKFVAEHPWHTEELELQAGQLVQIATDGFNHLIIEGSNWKNFVDPSDVNNDQNVTALDALTVINELGRRSHSDDLTFELNDAAILVTGEGHFYDQNGDGKCTALDALRVINELARISGGSGEGESVTADYLTGRQVDLWLQGKETEQDDSAEEDEFDESRLLYSDADVDEFILSERPEDLVYATVGQESTEAVDSLLSELEDWWK